MFDSVCVFGLLKMAWTIFFAHGLTPYRHIHVKLNKCPAVYFFGDCTACCVNTFFPVQANRLAGMMTARNSGSGTLMFNCLSCDWRRRTWAARMQRSRPGCQDVATKHTQKNQL